MHRMEVVKLFHWLVKDVPGLCLGLLLIAGCATGPKNYPLPATSVAPAPAVAEINEALRSAAEQALSTSADYRLGPEDVLQITLFNVPPGEGGVTPRETAVRVSHDGTITLPLLGDIPAAGLTTTELEQSLRQRYDRYLHKPEVGVYVKDYRGQPVSVVGAVHNPGVFQLTGPKTLIDLLAMAGGISEKAGGQVHIYRQNADERRNYVVDLFALAGRPGLVNMAVQAGDVINVPVAGMFFVDGAVARPGSYFLSRPYTLSQALTLAGGALPTLADYSGIAIFRRRDGLEAEKLPVNLNQIRAGEAPDPQVEPDDVIVVQMSTAKFLLERFIGRIGLPGVPAPRPY